MSSRIRDVSSILLAASLALVLSAPASADDDCHPLTLISSLQMVAGVDKAGFKVAEFVPVTINNVPKLMALDTGDSLSAVFSQSADELKLPREDMILPLEPELQGYMRSLVNVEGDASHQEADVSSFDLGRLEAKFMKFAIWPGNDVYSGGARIAGVLGSNVLKFYDVDIDFGTDKLNILSTDHCEGKVIYWPATTVAVLPMRLTREGHIAISVSLDGQPITAFIDTGTSRSSVMQPVAESDFRLKLGSADAPYVAQFGDDAASSIYRHKFSTLEFVGQDGSKLAVGNLQADLIPDYLNRVTENKPVLGTRLPDLSYNESTDMLIGMDVLRHLHVYIAYKEQKLYITPASVPQAPSVGASASTASAH